MLHHNQYGFSSTYLHTHARATTWTLPIVVLVAEGGVSFRLAGSPARMLARPRGRFPSRNGANAGGGNHVRCERSFVVKADMAERRVVIRVRGGTAEARRRLLAVIRSDFERNHGEIARLEVTAQVPLPDHPEVLRDYDELLTFERDGVREIPVKASGRAVLIKVSDLLNGVDLEVSRHKADILGIQKHAFRLFYSYSHKDESLRDELETHLKLLQREGLIHLARPPHPWRRGMGRPHRREPRSRRFHSAAGQCRLHRVGLLLREGNDARP